MSKSGLDLIFPFFLQMVMKHMQLYLCICLHMHSSQICTFLHATELTLNKIIFLKHCGFIPSSTPLNLNRLFCVRSQVKRSARPHLVITGVAWHFHQVALLKQDTIFNPELTAHFHNCKEKWSGQILFH